MKRGSRSLTMRAGRPKVKLQNVISSSRGIRVANGDVLQAASVGTVTLAVSAHDNVTLKNVLSLFVNLVAAVTFSVVAPEEVDWAVAGLIAAGSFAGGLVGAQIGRRLPAPVLRAVIVVVGVLAVVRLLTS